MSLSGNGRNSMDTTGRHVERFRTHWKAIVAFGIVSALLGVAALILSVTATLATVLMIGIFMMISGIGQLLIGFRTRSWGRFIALELAGAVYLVAGLFAVLSPLEASVVLTLLLGAGLIATAATRLYLGFQMSGSPNRSALLFAAVATGLLGILIIVGWPANSLFVLGTLLGVDLLLQGIAWTVLGMKIKPAT